MSPGAIEIVVADNKSFHKGSVNSESDIDDGPHIKKWVPLNVQFKAAGPSPSATKIDWIPSFSDYMNRVQRRLKEGLPSVQLPPSFPAVANGGPRWSKDNLKLDEVVLHFSHHDILEIEQGLAHFKNLGIAKDDISPRTFPLPSLSATLNKVSWKIHCGQGIAILRGLEPSRYSFEDNISIYAGIVSHIGEQRGQQDNDGNIIVHVKDVGSRVAPDHLRQSPYAHNAQPFHNDLGDVLAMYCFDKARTGGVSKVAAVGTVYNEIAAHRPDLIQELAAPDWAFDKHDGKQNYHSRPLFYYDQDKDRVSSCFSRRQLTGSSASPRPSYLPQLTEAQAEALDCVHFTADKHALKIQLKKGDIQLINNLAVLHAREAFTDGADNNKRHLVRMWLRNPELAWATPSELTAVWEEIYGEERRPIWYMSPDHERAHVINRYNSCHG